MEKAKLTIRSVILIVTLFIGYSYYIEPNISSVALIIFVFTILNLWNMTKRKKRVGIANKAVLITGCDSGFGYKLAQRLDGLGVHIFAGCLNTSGDSAKELISTCSDKLHIVQLDITQEAQIKDAFEEINSFCASKSTQFWALVNNAGLNYIGEVEFCDMYTYNQIANVNLFGTVHVTKTFLPLIRRFKGRILVTTSFKGRQNLPANSVYNITKAGLEAFGDILRVEMRKWGVTVVIMEPGNFGGTTGMLQMNVVQSWFDHQWATCPEEVKENYGEKYFKHYLPAVAEAAKTAHSSVQPVVNDLVDALTYDEPNYRYVTAGSNSWYDFEKWLMYAGLYLPTPLIDWIKIKWCYQGFPVPASLKHSPRLST